MSKVTLKFVKNKGSVPAGHIGEFGKEYADFLIEKGVAEIYIPDVSDKPKVQFNKTKEIK